MSVVSPYKGLLPFGEEDRHIFFGREREVAKSIEKLLANRFLAIVGPSGVGKSSLIRAGIVPVIRERYKHFEPIVFCQFGLAPINRLASALSTLSRNTKSSSTPLLIVDQFEELYTIADNVDRQNILRELVSLVDSQSAALLISLRADFFDQLLESPKVANYLEQSTILLSSLSKTSLREAIVKPAQVVGLSFEESLPDYILSEVGKNVGDLPLLQIMLNNLASKDNDGIITLADYQRLGELSGTLECILEEIWHSVESEDQFRIRVILLRLVKVSENTAPVRRAERLDNFSLEERPLIEHLVSRRILVIHYDDHSKQNTVEIAHEVIIRRWHRFAAWIQEEESFLIFRYRITDALDMWETSGNNSSFLLTEGMLDLAKTLLHHRYSALGIREIAFIQRSITANERFSTWETLAKGLGFPNLHKKLIEHDKRRANIQEQLSLLESQLRQLESQKTELSSKLRYNKEELEDMLPKVFLSYASEDFSRVQPIYEQLKQNGLNPWLDRENLLPGVDWDREIVREIKRSHFVLFCISSRSINKRGYVQKELRTALSAFDRIPMGQTYLIPVRLEECPIPDELSRYHFADVFRDGEFDKLLKSILSTWAESKESESN